MYIWPDTENDWIFVKDYGDSSEQLVTNNCTSCRSEFIVTLFLNINKTKLQQAKLLIVNLKYIGFSLLLFTISSEDIVQKSRPDS